MYAGLFDEVIEVHNCYSIGAYIVIICSPATDVSMAYLAISVGLRRNGYTACGGTNCCRWPASMEVNHWFGGRTTFPMLYPFQIALLSPNEVRFSLVFALFQCYLFLYREGDRGKMKNE